MAPGRPRAFESEIEDDVFDVMRDKLLAAGLTRRNQLFRDVPHTVMFVQAAETIRRLVDPKHEHYGVVSRYYDRISRPNAAVGGKVRNVWTNYLDGKITRSAAIDELVKWTMEKSRSEVGRTRPDRIPNTAHGCR